ncbi:tRNA (guanosine(46)-N7)-methyltransferase TrmB [Candidatus Peregrinibacteria bacterium CG10_big_fil_rev_8_21_14_0_10_36_19]|nr:MAG: tRNA (guanosine(46)-N7)-methyltransferase TrmB [Candidatus Peregrinibacteria bacterium CG10_big_fil_rev_8_21_14_0_10_36_19]
MPRNKQKQIDEVCSFENVFCEPCVDGKYFENDAPLILEIGCGYGHYTIAMAERFPEKNFLGVDKKGDRIWNASKNASKLSLKNAGFVRILIEEIGDFFPEGSVDEIWITFPDPFSKPCKHKKRLTSARFLAIYKRLLKPDGILHFKTDNLKLFDYSVEVVREHGEILEEVRDVHGGSDGPQILREVLTHYEGKFMDKGPIYYLRFRIS